MINKITATIGLLGSLLVYSEAASAQCQVTGATLDGGQVVECSGANPTPLVTTAQEDDITVFEGAIVGTSTLSGDPINSLEGDDTIRILGGSLLADTSVADNDCIRHDATSTLTVIVEGGLLECGEIIDSNSSGSLNFRMSDGVLRAGVDGEAIDGSGGVDIIRISGGRLEAGEGVLQLSTGNDIVEITGGELVQTTDSDENISLAGDDDTLIIRNATVDGSLADGEIAVTAGGGNDTVWLGDGANVIGIITGDGFPGPDVGSDTLVFGQTVPAQDIRGLCDQIRVQGGEGEITINGLDYRWTNFETVQCNLSVNPLAISTLDRNGLLLLCLLLGGFGILVVRHQA